MIYFPPPYSVYALRPIFRRNVQADPIKYSNGHTSTRVLILPDYLPDSSPSLSLSLYERRCVSRCVYKSHIIHRNVLTRVDWSRAHLEDFSSSGCWNAAQSLIRFNRLFDDGTNVIITRGIVLNTAEEGNFVRTFINLQSCAQPTALTSLTDTDIPIKNLRATYTTDGRLASD